MKKILISLVLLGTMAFAVQAEDQFRDLSFDQNKGFTLPMLPGAVFEKILLRSDFVPASAIKEINFHDVAEFKISGPDYDKLLIIIKKSGDSFVVPLGKIRYAERIWGNTLIFIY